MPRLLAKAVALLAMVLFAAACGYAASAFDSDGGVTVELKVLFPADLLHSGGTTGVSAQGFSPADISKELDKKYPAAEITLVNAGSESGAPITIPFKIEKDAMPLSALKLFEPTRG